MNALELDRVSAGYPGRPVLDTVNFTLPASGMAAILGPNGAGKSTLLRVATGWLPAASGSIRIFGEPLATLPPRRRASLVAVVPQDFTVSMPFTVEEVVRLGRSAATGRNTRPTSADLAAVADALAATGTAELRNRLFPELSGGERQRVAVAFALAAHPKLLVLDEPASHLDLRHKVDLLALLARLNRETGLSVLMVGHDLTMAATFFPRLVLVDAGRIVADGTPEDVLRPDVLQPVYRCAIRIGRSPDNTPCVFPSPAPGDTP